MPQQNDSMFDGASPFGGPQFPTTRWSLVLEAGQSPAPEAQAAVESSDDPLEQLCRAYWTPVYAYFRRHIPDVDEARDITQDFFTRLLEKRIARTADPDRGRFRTFLLTAAQRFLINERKAAGTLKRGGDRKHFSIDADRDSVVGLEPVDSLTPEKQFERQWVSAMLARVLDRLREDSSVGQRFDQLSAYLVPDEAQPPYAAIAADLGISVTAARVQVFRLRGRYRELLHHEIAQTLGGATIDVEEELGALFGTFE